MTHLSTRATTPAQLPAQASPLRLNLAEPENREQFVNADYGQLAATAWNAYNSPGVGRCGVLISESQINEGLARHAKQWRKKGRPDVLTILSEVDFPLYGVPAQMLLELVKEVGCPTELVTQLRQSLQTYKPQEQFVVVFTYAETEIAMLVVSAKDAQTTPPQMARLIQSLNGPANPPAQNFKRVPKNKNRSSNGQKR